MPGVSVAEQRPQVLMNLRGLDPHGLPILTRCEQFWAEHYPAPGQTPAPHIVFGHNAQRDVQIHPLATGLDTGCVYGGHLTAMVLPPHATVPPPEHRRDVLVQVPAHRAWVAIS